MQSSKDNLEFITHAKQDIPLLIAEIEYLKSMHLNKKIEALFRASRASILLKQSV